MSAILPIDGDGLLRNRGVESERVELKASWDPATTGPQVLKTVCAFANDYHNLNGGYVVIGAAERDGRAVLPPVGLSDADVEAAQKWILGNCKRIDPPYFPVLSPETVEDRRILVVWAPGSDTKPHRAPGAASGSSRYWVRLGAETVDAERRGGLLRELIQQTARVPWDDRPARDARVEDMSEAKVREHLRDTRSGLLDESDTRDVYRRMKIVVRINEHEAPRNAGLLFFSRDPVRWFRGAKIEVVQFAAHIDGDVQEERIFGGDIADQIRDSLSYIENLSTSHLHKQENGVPVHGWVGYPMPALRETVVNAIYHRGYDVDQPDPTKIYLYPDRMEITSYPGPVPGIEPRHLRPGAKAPSAPARNRRIGEFLKELGLAEGRLSGVPRIFRSMKDNGSPRPEFDFDENRTYFRATLPAHPEYGALSAVRDAAHLRSLGQQEEAFRRIETAWDINPSSAALAAEMIRALGESGEYGRAEEILKIFEERGPEIAASYVTNVLVETLVTGGDMERARQLLKHRRAVLPTEDSIDAAIMARRAREPRIAHRYFERAGDAVYANPRAMLEFAQTKIRLAQEARWRGRRGRAHRATDSSRRFLAEARGLLERVVQMDTSPSRRAWAWREIGRALNFMRAPHRDIEDAYRRAIELLPEESRFTRELEGIRTRRR